MELINSGIVTELNQLPDMCIFGLINEADKTVYLYRTKNIVTAFNRIIKEYKYSNKNVLSLPLIIIEDIKDSNNLWVRYNYWIKYYSSNGYNVINKCKYNIKYKLRKQILKDFRMQYEVRPLFYVKVVSQRHREVIVGIFDHVTDMDEFVNKYYPNGLIEDIVYSSNSLTKEYRNDSQQI